ncbi:uncharacterized protein LOC103823181 [Serinus canaria]|uniref:uncharacterized protein LOC103823181 n=1 Tax=Serinus canaria TaxID=9135 RepID=UPI0021CC68EB|nr:uncharacterized protein LOC103823181 [Serinus canaria]
MNEVLIAISGEEGGLRALERPTMLLNPPVVRGAAGEDPLPVRTRAGRPPTPLGLRSGSARSIRAPLGRMALRDDTRGVIPLWEVWDVLCGSPSSLPDGLGRRRAAGSGAREPGRALPSGGGCAEPRGVEPSCSAARPARPPPQPAQPPVPWSHEQLSVPAEPPEQPPSHSPPALLGFPAPLEGAHRWPGEQAAPAPSLLHPSRFLASPAGPCRISALGCVSGAEPGAPCSVLGPMRRAGPPCPSCPGPQRPALPPLLGTPCQPPQRSCTELLPRA